MGKEKKVGQRQGTRECMHVYVCARVRACVMVKLV